MLLHYIYGDFSWCMQQCLLLGRGLYSECLLIESSLSYVCINPHKRGEGYPGVQWKNLTSNKTQSVVSLSIERYKLNMGDPYEQQS